ncbi:MAG: hypothetical protein KDD56_00405 [Bdellovibrionales bacterium]|nr:hypothetical protein [Bdellovibrionales bacterium]
MQIITIDNEQFAELVEVVKHGELIGTYQSTNGLQTVHINNQFIVISPEKFPNKKAYKPTKNHEEALYLANQILRKELERGNQVEFENQD